MTAYLLTIGYSRITPANLNGFGKSFTGIDLCRSNSDLTC